MIRKRLSPRSGGSPVRRSPGASPHGSNGYWRLFWTFSYLAFLGHFYWSVVGTLAESAPPGLGFSDTAFCIFILIASRWLKSDRFFTTDFTPKVYPPAGFDWIRDNNFRSVLVRHCRHLRLHFADIRNVFFTWEKSGG
jgi:Animal haem peroxidase